MWENWRQTILSAGKKQPAPLFLPFFPVLFSFHVVFYLSSWCFMPHFPPFSLFFKHSLHLLSSFLSSGFSLSILVSPPCHLCLFLLFITPLVLLPLLSVTAFLFPYSPFFLLLTTLLILLFIGLCLSFSCFFHFSASFPSLLTCPISSLTYNFLYFVCLLSLSPSFPHPYHPALFALLTDLKGPSMVNHLLQLHPLTKRLYFTPCRQTQEVPHTHTHTPKTEKSSTSAAMNTEAKIISAICALKWQNIFF